MSEAPERILLVPWAVTNSAPDWEEGVAFPSSDGLESLADWEKEYATEYTRSDLATDELKPEKTVVAYVKNMALNSAGEVEVKARNIVALHLAVPHNKVTAKANLVYDLCADSLDCVELVMSFENEFGIEISYEDAERIKTFSDVVTLLERLSPDATATLTEREAQVRNDALREAANAIIHTHEHPEDNRTWVGERPYICEENAYRAIEALITEKNDE